MCDYEDKAWGISEGDGADLYPDYGGGLHKSVHVLKFMKLYAKKVNFIIWHKVKFKNKIALFKEFYVFLQVEI